MVGLRRFVRVIPVWIVAGMLAALAGCARSPAPPKLANLVVVPAVHEQKSLVFYDSDVFDLGFADALRDEPDKVHVTFAGPTTLNAFPARMNVWLAEVKKSGGTVAVKDPAQKAGSRGLFGIGMIFDLIDAVTTMREREAKADRLALVDDYDATILYDSTTGDAREVVFSRRPPATTAS